MHRPLLQDVELSRVRFNPGDRVLARISCGLRHDQRLKLTRAICKMAKVPVRIFFVDVRKMQLKLIRGGQTEILASPLNIEAKAQPLPGVLNLSLGVVEFMDGDIVEVQCIRMESDQWRTFRSVFLEWAGKDVDARYLPPSLALV